MKFYVKVFIVSLSWFILINFISFGATVFAASAVGPSIGTPIPFGQLPAEQQNPFHVAVGKFVRDLFGLANEDTFTYIDPDTGAQYTGTESDIKSYIYSHADELGVKGVQDDSGNLTKYIIDPNVVFSSAEARLSYVIVSSYIEATPDVEYIYTEHGISSTMAADLYYDALKKVGAAVLSNTASGSLSHGIEIIGGVPQNVTTIKQDSYISVFDTLGLEYTVAPSLLDFQFNVLTNNRYVPGYGYTPYFITSDNKLYLFHANIYTGYNGDNNLLFYSFSNGMNTSLSYSISYNFHYTGRFSFRFVDNSGHLYFCLLSSSYISKNNKLNYVQCTHGRPDVSNAPLLFYDYRDGLEAPASAVLNTDFKNYIMPDGYDISFVFSVDKSDVLTDSAILSADIIAAGYFYGDKNSIGYSSSILNSAGQMLLSSENVVSGGDKTVSTELSDLQKAIYILAQQQGTTYEDLLSKMDIIIDSTGTVTIAGIDGIEYSISDLAKSFDKVIGSVGEISGDLSELLEYLKSLNIEGVDGYISSIEGTLNDLNERDKDHTAVLGDCLGSLQDLKKALDEAELKGLSSDVRSIAQSISHAMELEDALEIEGVDSSFIIDKFPFSLPFDLYHIVTLFVREPVEPIFTIPIETEINAFGLNETIDEEIVLDLTMFKINGVDIVQAVLRFSIIVGYVIMLIKLTTKFFV